MIDIREGREERASEKMTRTNMGRHADRQTQTNDFTGLHSEAWRPQPFSH